MRESPLVGQPAKRTTRLSSFRPMPPWRGRWTAAWSRRASFLSAICRIV